MSGIPLTTLSYDIVLTLDIVTKEQKVRDIENEIVTLVKRKGVMFIYVNKRLFIYHLLYMYNNSKTVSNLEPRERRIRMTYKIITIAGYYPYNISYSQCQHSRITAAVDDITNHIRRSLKIQPRTVSV